MNKMLKRLYRRKPKEILIEIVPRVIKIEMDEQTRTSYRAAMEKKYLKGKKEKAND